MMLGRGLCVRLHRVLKGLGGRLWFGPRKGLRRGLDKRLREGLQGELCGGLKRRSRGRLLRVFGGVLVGMLVMGLGGKPRGGS